MKSTQLLCLTSEIMIVAWKRISQTNGSSRMEFNLTLTKLKYHIYTHCKYIQMVPCTFIIFPKITALLRSVLLNQNCWKNECLEKCLEFSQCVQLSKPCPGCTEIFCSQKLDFGKKCVSLFSEKVLKVLVRQYLLHTVER